MLDWAQYPKRPSPVESGITKQPKDERVGCRSGSFQLDGQFRRFGDRDDAAKRSTYARGQVYPDCVRTCVVLVGETMY